MSGLEVQKTVKIRKQEVFLPRRQTFKTFQNKIKIQKKARRGTPLASATASCLVRRMPVAAISPIDFVQLFKVQHELFDERIRKAHAFFSKV